ncbi:MAG: hypothetical protein U1E76_24025 [Planctomycetota bacterium]
MAIAIHVARTEQGVVARGAGDGQAGNPSAGAENAWSNAPSPPGEHEQLCPA